MRFQIGDRVCCLADGGGDSFGIGSCAGQEGVIVVHDPVEKLEYGVEFYDRFPQGHNLTGNISSNRGWWCSQDALGSFCASEEVIFNGDLSEVL